MNSSILPPDCPQDISLETGKYFAKDPKANHLEQESSMYASSAADEDTQAVQDWKTTANDGKDSGNSYYFNCWSL